MADQVDQSMEKISDDELDQIIQDMEQEEPPKEETQSKVVPMSVKNGGKTSSTQEQCLSLELTGAINLKLCFSSGERSIEVFCTEEALICRMADGTEFKIPTGIPQKKAAA